MPAILPPTYLAGFGFEFPGPRLPLRDLLSNERHRARLEQLGQEFTYRADSDSTTLAIAAAQKAISAAGSNPDDISLVISAPSLLSAYGLEIPAVAARARLGLRNAECLNLAQGCVGILTGLRLAAMHLAIHGGEALILTGCMASTITEEMTHGAFFWGDAGGAVVLRAGNGPGPRLVAYAETSADDDWGAMRVPLGDARHQEPAPGDKIVVAFPDARAQARYVGGERERFRATLDRLLQAGGLRPDQLEALFLPATGRNRAASLLNQDQALLERLGTDFAWPHLGGIDVLLFLERHLQRRQPSGSGHYALLSPAFTAQWAGLLLQGET